MVKLTGGRFGGIQHGLSRIPCYCLENTQNEVRTPCTWMDAAIDNLKSAGRKRLSGFKSPPGTNNQIGAINHAFIGEAGFQMVVPFNGVSADCYGRWWAIWSASS